MQQSSHIFSYSHDTVQNSFNGSQSLFSVIIQYIQSTKMKGVYTYAIGLPHQAVVVMVEDGSPASCGQTAMVTTVL